MESDPHEKAELLAQQRNILRLMRRSHRFLMGHIFSTVFGMYIVMLWVILLVALMGLPPPLLSIATLIIVIPILIAPLQYRSAKSRFRTLQIAGDSLKEIEKSLNESIVVSGLTSYIFLIFDVLRPDEYKIHSKSENEIENLRNNLAGLTRKIVGEICFQSVLFYFLIVNFLIPEFIDAITSGSLIALTFAFSLVFLAIILIILSTRWIIFLYWRLLVRRWLRFYQGFISWGEELERMFMDSSNKNDGRANP